MAAWKEMRRAWAAAIGPRRYILPSLAIFIGGAITYFAPHLGVELNGALAYLPIAIGMAVAAGMVVWWLVDHAAQLRAELRGIADIEQKLDVLSTMFDDGNNRIFNAELKSDKEFDQWLSHHQNWSDSVEQYLQTNFGLRERNIFRNIVLVNAKPIVGSYDQRHNYRRCMVAQQLEKMRETIIRYSDLAERRRAEAARD